MFPQDFNWLVPSMKIYYIQIGILQSLTITQLFILIKKLWSFKNLDKQTRSNWAGLLIIFNSISSLIFIWKKVDEFSKINNTSFDNNNK